MRFDRKIKIRLYFGSAQTQHPVNPVCPNVSGDAEAQVGPVDPDSGLSNPIPRRLPVKF